MKKSSKRWMQGLLVAALLAALAVSGINALIVSDISHWFGGDAPGPAGEPRTYQVFNQAGLDVLQPLVFNGGDKILFERGRSFKGPLSLKRSGIRPDQVITVGDFGDSDAQRGRMSISGKTGSKV